MDDIDKKLLENLEVDARVSLKNLAKELNVKTSTIYHRLHKLKESNILEQFTIVINPESIGLTVFYFINVKLKKLVIGDLDSMFLESFAKFLSENHDSIVFVAVGSDSIIHTIGAFQNQDEFEKFTKDLENNPYVEDVDTVGFKSVIKGKKIFTFPKNLVLEEEKGELFDDGNEEDAGDLDLDDDNNEITFEY